MRRRRGSRARRRARRRRSSAGMRAVVVVHSVDARRRLRAGGEVGDEVDGAGGQHGAVRRRRARGRATSAACGSGSISASPDRRAGSASECSVAGESARGLRAAREHHGGAGRQERRAACRGVLVVEDRHDRDHRPLARRTSGSESTNAAIPLGLWAPSSTVSGSRSTTCRRPGTCTAAAAARTAAASSRPRKASAAARREREVARAGTRPAAATARRRGRPARARAARPSRSAAARASSSTSGCEVAADHERRRRPHDGELLARDVAQRRAEPARVLEPDVGEHLHARVDARSWRRSGRRGRPR